MKPGKRASLLAIVTNAAIEGREADAKRLYASEPAMGYRAFSEALARGRRMRRVLQEASALAHGAVLVEVAA